MIEIININENCCITYVRFDSVVSVQFAEAVLAFGEGLEVLAAVPAPKNSVQAEKLSVRDNFRHFPCDYRSCPSEIDVIFLDWVEVQRANDWKVSWG